MWEPTNSEESLHENKLKLVDIRKGKNIYWHGVLQYLIFDSKEGLAILISYNMY